MGRKNAYLAELMLPKLQKQVVELQKQLAELQEQKEKEVHETSIRMAYWTQQAGYDALVMTLGHDNVVYGNNMSAEVIEKVAAAWAKNMTFVIKGMGMETDADYYRAKTDEKVKAKVPEAVWEPWEQRYVQWRERTTEEEAGWLRKYWEEQGYDLRPIEEV